MPPHLFAGRDGAGHAELTVFVDDLDAQLAAVAARGLEPDDVETYFNGVRKAVFRDPDGNKVGVGGAPCSVYAIVYT
jgi:catechol 2,3-dioxygenase-like lactoylglutathione lyase family enzyme